MTVSTIPRKRTISEAVDDLTHQVSNVDCSSDTNSESSYERTSDGLRRRRVARESTALEVTESFSDPAKEVQSVRPTKHKSVVPLSMQLLRPFWSMSCCPDCLQTGNGNDSLSPMLLDSRLRSVSTASLYALDTPAASRSRKPSSDDGASLLLTSEQKTSVSSSVSSQSTQDITCTVATPAPTTLTIYEGSIEQIIAEYTAACQIYGCSARINSGVLTSIRFSLPTLRVSGNFFDADMLALVEVLLKHCNGALSFITRLDFSIAGKEGRNAKFGGGGGSGKKGFRSHGAYALSRVLQVSKFITEVYMPNNRVGPYGATALFEAVRENTTLKTLLMQGCRIGEKGALAFATHICGEGSQSVLEEVDLSINRIGFRGCYELERALKEQMGKSSLTDNGPHLMVNLDANMVLQEVMNSVTHGLGIVLAIIAACLLTKRAQGLPSHYVISCAIYSTALIVLYTISTLYHSFFALPTVKFIFKVIDRCAIYVLIAGSYSPFLMIALQHNEVWSMHLLLFIWACAFGGMFVEATMWHWKHKPKFSLSLYLFMGWSCLICFPDLVNVLSSNALGLLVAGGVSYTAGIPFFVRNSHLDHAIWHLFVLVGSICHWLCVYLHVIKL
eukprot:CCRYP_008942-RE/>CCRYP_008942-RE protein AED:0.36 eAED:0.36 QI:119/1/1/1/0/0/3/534/615